MKINVSGKNVSMSDSLKGHVDSRLSESVGKYFDQAVGADVTFSKERSWFMASVVVNEGTGKKMMFKSEYKDKDIYAAFDESLRKVEKQLRRYKRKLKNHHNVGISKGYDSFSEMPSDAANANDTEISASADEALDSALVIDESATDLEILSVSDAVMRLDLGDLPALVFKNRSDNQISVVYRRRDGNIAWFNSSRKTVQNVA